MLDKIYPLITSIQSHYIKHIIYNIESNKPEYTGGSNAKTLNCAKK